MKRVVIDDSVAQSLAAPADAVQVCTKSGRIVGYFTPTGDPESFNELDSPCSNDELRRRLREEDGRPLADILRDLESRT
jgi:hypothetical protein